MVILLRTLELGSLNPSRPSCRAGAPSEEARLHTPYNSTEQRNIQGLGQIKFIRWQHVTLKYLKQFS